MALHVLVVDDQDELRETLALVLEDEGYHVSTAGNGMQALDALAGDCPDLVLTDIEMPVLDGLELARRVRTTAPETAVVLMSGRRDVVAGARAVSADACLEKPFEIDDLLAVLARVRPTAA